MPTITTTVTSACASGVVTTQTTTQATPEAVVAKKSFVESTAGMFFHDGRVIQVAKVVAPTQKGFDAIVASFQHCQGVAEGTNSYLNILDTGNKSCVVVYQFGSEDAFHKAELLFGGLVECELAISEGVAIDCYMGGNITAEMSQKLMGTWDAVPTFNIHLNTHCTGLLSDLGDRAAQGNLFGYVCEATLASQENVEKVMEQSLIGLAGLAFPHYCESAVNFFLGGGEILCFAVFKKEGYEGFLHAAGADAEFGQVVVETYSGGPADFYNFGATDAIRAGLQPWEDAIPSVTLHFDKSIGGSDHAGQGGCVCTAFYATSADRNTAQNKFAELAEKGNEFGICSFASVDNGVSGMQVFFMASTTSGWEGLNGIAGADASFGEKVCGAALHFEIQPLGDCSADYFNTLHDWEKGYAQVKYSGSNPIDYVQSSYAASDASICGVQTLTYPSVAQTDAAVMFNLKYRAHIVASGINCYWFRPSDTTLLQIFAWPTVDCLKDLNKRYLGDEALAGEIAAVLTEVKSECKLFGKETAEIAEELAPWKAMDGFNIGWAPLKGGFC